jgi:hypothetical protein
MMRIPSSSQAWEAIIYRDFQERSQNEDRADRGHSQRLRALCFSHNRAPC